MTEQELFTIVGIRQKPETFSSKKTKQTKKKPKIPAFSLAILGLLICGCLCADIITAKDPSFLDLENCTIPPNSEFLFGTDTLGRDIFACIWYGGRVSLLIGLFAAIISTVIAVIYGSLSGIAPLWLDALLMRLTEIFLSVPSLLVIIFVQAMLGEASILTLSLVIGVTSWYSIAKIVRTEVRQIRNSEYIVAAKCMGSGFFPILYCHLLPNFLSSIMFMIVMNIRTAIVFESTLSFMGIGLPLEIISWGSMLSLSENALMAQAWWIILIPGSFLIALLMCIANIGNWLQKSTAHKERYL